MFAKIHYDCFEDTLPRRNGNLHYKIIFPAVTFPVKTESRGRLNDRLLSVAVFIRSIAKDIATHRTHELRQAQDIFFEMKCTYNEGLFLSFCGEGVIRSDGGIMSVFYITKTFKTSSAQEISLDMLLKPGTEIHTLCGKILSANPHYEDLTPEILGENFNPANFYLTEDEAVIFFPPQSIIRYKNDYTFFPVNFRHLKDLLKYGLY